jgi:hypothetical protein
MNQDMILKQAAEAAMQVQDPFQQQQPQGVVPSPVPMTLQMTTVQDMQGNKYVVLIIQHPMGQTVLHFDPDGAEQIAEGLKNTARLARTGLEIAR